MTATKVRLRPRAPLLAGFAGSAALHGALFAAVAAIPAAWIARASAAGDDGPPLAVSWVVAPAAQEPLVVAAFPAVVSEVPRPRPEVLEVPDFALADPEPPRLFTERDVPQRGEAPTVSECLTWRRVVEFASLRPGRGAPGAGTNAGRGRGAIGVGAGGPGGDDVGQGGGGAGGSSTGAGSGDGSEGAGTGWAAHGGATRGPEIVGALAAPAYPSNARAHGWEGRVVLLLTIDERGRVTSVEVAESSGRSALDDAARDAAAAWTLSPALRDGEPVAGTLRVPVRFELTD
jgi:protein TonB